MTIDKNFLKKFKTINLVFSNGGKFNIPIAEITEIRCDAADTRRRSGDRFRIWDGFFKISPKGAQTFTESYDEEQRRLDAKYGKG